jgi:hypothetical protein
MLNLITDPPSRERFRLREEEMSPMCKEFGPDALRVRAE